MKYFQKLVYLITLAALIFTTRVNSIQAQGPTAFPNCRLGVGGAFAPQVGGYDLAQLNTGMYLDWESKLNPVSQIGLPATIEYLQVVRIHQNKVGSTWHGNGPYVNPPSYSVAPSLSNIANRAANNPGSLWFIGNEIERRDWNNGDGTWGGQDEITPELYAKAFHEIRAVIKAADPTARIGTGSVIEPTPLRLKYLDRVWDSYYTQYGYSMGQDIDVWNIHAFLLREVKNSWGAEIPAGLNDTSGFLSGAGVPAVLSAHHNIANFKQFTEDMRAWMAAHGERNKPLINTEYGVLYKTLGTGQITPAQVSSYLTASFDYMLNTKNANTGYPADENRLVQGWVWYSLNDTNWNGTLFNPANKTLSSVGTTWKNYVADPAKPLASIPKPNLLALNPEAAPITVLPGSTTTATLRVDIANSGNTTTNTGNNLVIKFWDGAPGAPGSTVIATKTVNDLPGCGRFTSVQAQWSGLEAGNHTWYVQAVPIGGETQTSDNTAQSSVVVSLESSANLALVKDASAEAVTVGSALVYTTTVTNHGPDLASGVIFTDTLSSGATSGPAIPSQGSCTGTTTITCSLNNLASGAEATITRLVTPTAAGTLVNTGQVVSEVFDPNTPNNVVVKTTTVTAPSLQFSASSYTVNENNTPAVITVSRTGASSGPISVQYATSNGTAVAGSDYTTKTGALNWSAGDLAPKTFTISILNDAAVEADETVNLTLSSPTGGAVLGNPDTATLFILNDDVNSSTPANLAVVKTGSPNPVIVGHKLTYVITVTNHGPNPATGVKLTDVLPADVTFGSAVPSQGNPCTGSSTISCNLGNLGNGATAKVTVVVTPTKTGTLANTVSVTGNEIDPNSSNDIYTENTQVNEGGTIKVQKYQDSNANGQKNSGEPGLNGWSIILYTAQNQALTSGKTKTIGSDPGWVQFNSIPPGNYKVCEVLPAQGDWVNSDPANGSRCKAVTITASPGVKTLRLGNYQRNSLTIVKNAAITYDFDFTGTLGNFTLTSASLQASRQFSNLAPGSYTIAEKPASFPDPTWGLQSITCKDDKNKALAVNVNLDQYKAVIPLQSGQHITCTFHNHWNSAPAADHIYLPILLK